MSKLSMTAVAAVCDRRTSSLVTGGHRPPLQVIAALCLLASAFCLAAHGATPFPLGFFKTVAAGGAPFSGLVSTNNLKAHWRLNESSGTRVDVHRGEDLTDNNTVGSAAGKIGNAADFIPANSEFLSRANDADQVGGDTDWTMCGWYKPDAVGADYTVWAMHGDTGTANGYWLLASFGSLNYYNERTGSDLRTVSSSTNLSAATWYFIAHGHDAAADQIWISVNGGDKQTATSGGAITVTATEAFRVGANSGATPNYQDGLIDSVSWFREKLSDADIDDLYNAGSGLDY